MPLSIVFHRRAAALRRSVFGIVLATVPALIAAPTAGSPVAYRDAEFFELRWKTADPADALSRGSWWDVYADPTLDDLELRALKGNQDLRAAAARGEQARAPAGVARREYSPQIAAGGLVSRERTSS